MAVFEAHDPDLLDLLAAFTARAAKASAGAPPRWLEDAMSEIPDMVDTDTLMSDRSPNAREFIRFIFARSIRRWFGKTPVGPKQRARTDALRCRATDRIKRNSRYPSRMKQGIADKAHLCRSLRRQCGLTPRTYRSHCATTPGNLEQVSKVQVSESG